MFEIPKHNINTGLCRMEVDNFRHFGTRAGMNIKRLNVFIGPNGHGKSTFVNLYRMFEECIRKKKVGRIGLATLNRYVLVTPKQDDFTLRFFYDNGTFTEVSYRIADNLVWQATAYRLGRYDNNQFIEAVSFTAQKGLELHKDGLITYLRELPEFRMVALNETLKTPQPSTGQENAEGEAQRIAVMSELVVLMVLDIFSGELRLKVLDNFKEKNPFLPLTENLYDQYFEGSILLANAEIDYAPWGALCSPLERVGLEIDESETLDAPLNLQEFAAQFGSEEGYDGIRCLLARILHRKKGSRRLQEFIGKRTFLDDDVERFDLVHSTMNAYRVLVKQLNAMLLLSSFTAAGLRGPRRSFVGDAKDYVKTFYEWRINAPTSDLIGISALFDRKVSGHPLLESVLDEIERKGSVSVEMPQLELLLTITYDTTRISLMGKLERSGKEIALSSLSKGEDRMLLVKLAQKWSSYLEEPETNLHPTNQAQIGRMLAESLIHYSHFYNAIEDKNHYSTPTAKEEFNGFVPPDVFDEERRSYCAWIQGIRSIRGYEVTFVETHSEPLIRAIQMEIAKNLPRLEWIERANGDLDAHLKQRLQQEPNIEITYFDTVEGKVVPRSLGLRRDGVIAHRISQDFFYDTEPLFAAIFDGIELN